MNFWLLASAVFSPSQTADDPAALVVVPAMLIPVVATAMPPTRAVALTSTIIFFFWLAVRLRDNADSCLGEVTHESEVTHVLMKNVREPDPSQSRQEKLSAKSCGIGRSTAAALVAEGGPSPDVWW